MLTYDHLLISATVQVQPKTILNFRSAFAPRHRGRPGCMDVDDGIGHDAFTGAGRSTARRTAQDAWFHGFHSFRTNIVRVDHI